MITRTDQAMLVNAWHAADDATFQPRVQHMVAAEIARIHRAFSRLPIRVKFVEHDPYQSFEEMRDQVQSTGQMLVWTGASDTPLWDPQTNWMARAVHDYDHIVKSCGFDLEGEAAAYRSAAACMPGLAPIYLSEIMLQAAIKNYTGEFVPQKLVVVPEEIQRKAGQLRGRKKSKAQDAASTDPALKLVWSTAGLLRVTTPAMAMVHLKSKGLTYEQAAVIVDAAVNVNAAADNPSMLAGLRGPSMHSAIIAKANEASRASRRRGPQLPVQPSREDLIGWLVWNDPNGIYTDEDLAREDMDPMTLADAYEQLVIAVADA